MANDRSSVLPADNNDWDKAWDAINRLGAARKHLERDTAGETATLAPDTAKHDVSVIAPMRPRPPHRPLAVWILIGALWISIGMIVSAAIVSIAYLV